MKRWLGYFTIEYGTANSMVNWKIASNIFLQMSYQPLFKLDSIEMCFSISLIWMCYIYSCVKILQILPKQCNSGSWMLIFRSLSQRIMTIFPLMSVFKPHWCFQVLFLASLSRCRFIDLEDSIQSSQQLSFATMSSSSNWFSIELSSLIRRNFMLFTEKYHLQFLVGGLNPFEKILVKLEHFLR